jgi:SAM-dependent methyltransferase
MSADPAFDPAFRGEIAAYYARYRRGYPDAVVDAIAAAFDLGPADTVLDLGCGTGQLSVPLATRAGNVIGMDPEPDMLTQAKQNQIKNIRWVRGADRDVATQNLTGLAAMTVAVAIHWMDGTRCSARSARRPVLRALGRRAAPAAAPPRVRRPPGSPRAHDRADRRLPAVRLAQQLSRPPRFLAGWA